MSKDQAKQRIKEIELEQQKIDKIWLPSYLLFLATVVGNLLANKNVLPSLFNNDYLLGGMTLISCALLYWVFLKSQKVNRERDVILAEHGMW